MATIERAIEIAASAHAGQLDKAGAPYVFHPLRLMFAVDTPHERMIAVLHDVVEDSDVTLEDLKKEGFPAEVVDAVDALTRRPGESRIQAAQRAVRNPVARRVKIADVSDNMNISRITNPTKKDFARLREYVQVLEVLRNARQISKKRRGKTHGFRKRMQTSGGQRILKRRKAKGRRSYEYDHHYYYQHDYSARPDNREGEVPERD